MSVSYDKDVDYAAQLQSMMSAGATAAEVEEVLQQRVAKATSESGYADYAYDSMYETARAYIANQNNYSSSTNNTESFTSSSSSDYTTYTDALMESVTALLERDSFTYNLDDDAVFQSYADMYAREGDRAATNTLGEVATLTGGMASTAAVTAASQSQDYYTSKLSDVMPQLYAMAYDMYTAEGDDLRADIEMLASLSSAAYDRMESEFATNYAISSDASTSMTDIYYDAKDANSDAYSANSSTSNEFFDRAMAFLEQGIMPSDSMLKAAGLDYDTAEAYRVSALRKLSES